MSRTPLTLLLCSFLFAQTTQVLGDMNEDSMSNILDVVRSANIILHNGDSPSDYELWMSDVNYDLTTDIVDIVLLVDSIVVNDCPPHYSECVNNQEYCCHDTTNADYTWEVHVLGNAGGQSTIFDVSIISENDIWAVGQYIRAIIDEPIYHEFYNAAHWDGEEWEYIAVPVPVVDDDGEIWAYCTASISSITTFGTNNIWFIANLHTIIHWDGTEFTDYVVGIDWNENYNPLTWASWGSNSDNIYLGSAVGNIFHFDGSELSEFGFLPVPLKITKITGSQGLVYCLAKNLSGEYSGQSIIVKIQNGIIEPIVFSPNSGVNEENRFGLLQSIWSFGGNLYVMASGGLFFYDADLENFFMLYGQEELDLSYPGFSDMDGNSPIDFLVIKHHGSIYHFSELEWSLESSLEDNYDIYITQMQEIDVHGDLIAIGGRDYNTNSWASVTIGVRNLPTE